MCCRLNFGAKNARWTVHAYEQHLHSLHALKRQTTSDTNDLSLVSVNAGLYIACKVS